jgi:hypothetical protein
MGCGISFLAAFYVEARILTLSFWEQAYVKGEDSDQAQQDSVKVHVGSQGLGSWQHAGL